MNLPKELYTVRYRDRYAGTVTNARIPKSYVFGFTKAVHTQKFCNILTHPHKIEMRKNNSVVITKLAGNPTLEVDEDDLEIVCADTEELLAYIYIHNTRLFIVRRFLLSPEKNMVVFTTDINPNNIELDQEVVVENLECLYDLSEE